MGNWFSWLFGSTDVPTPVGFRRISELPRPTPKQDHTFQVLDWRPTPHPPHEIGSFFVWLEVDGRREQFFVSRAESVHFDPGPSSNANYVRVAKHRGRWYVLPVNPKGEKRVTYLPPPPASFPSVENAPRTDAPGASPSGVAKRNQNPEMPL